MTLTAHPVAHALNHLSGVVGFRADIQRKFQQARANLPGWSTEVHLLVFESLLANAAIRDVLVCGVYHGLDLRLMQAAARTASREGELRFTGIDLFSDQPCADWPEDKRGMTWEAAGFGPAPSLACAQANAPFATIIQGDAAEHMAQTPAAYDLIYLDTSHDEATVRREINAATSALRPHGILCGDDYTGPDPKWGVAQAVQALLPHHAVLFDRIWLSNHPTR